MQFASSPMFEPLCHCLWMWKRVFRQVQTQKWGKSVKKREKNRYKLWLRLHKLSFHLNIKVSNHHIKQANKQRNKGTNRQANKQIINIFSYSDSLNTIYSSQKEDIKNYYTRSHAIFGYLGLSLGFVYLFILILQMLLIWQDLIVLCK